ncbi:lipoprotein signal peptidase [Desulfuromonas sp. DDH964]|uniref:signal peptidase II n=1 Tax=Desulfuromonas sp. DDH964 TaxID=1823759 RepID=UPI00078CA5D2|nr:signal peptidase II [Desulfuromonas sp. DDH964]AMV70662.1 lipoprotein signal peptidase [Desulfuromonas sp. DDH964]
MTIIRRILLMAPVILSCVGCDRITKAVAREYLAGSPELSFLGDLFRLQYAENPGAFLGMGSGLPESARFWVFIMAVGAVLLGVLVWTLSSRSLRPVGVGALSLVLGGGLSNLYDRVVNDGAVVDFLNLGLGGLRTGVFNVADVAITTGVTLLLIGELMRSRKEPEYGKS